MVRTKTYTHDMNQNTKYHQIVLNCIFWAKIKSKSMNDGWKLMKFLIKISFTFPTWFAHSIDDKKMTKNSNKMIQHTITMEKNDSLPFGRLYNTDTVESYRIRCLYSIFSCCCCSLQSIEEESTTTTTTTAINERKTVYISFYLTCRQESV